MTVSRIPVSAPKNIFFDSQDVDDDDLTTEQNFNDQIQSGIINNHLGTGVLPDALIQHVLFDSSLANGLLDGKPINAQAQPTDNNFGNQLEIELSNSNAAGKRFVKVLVIGLDFQNNLQYDTFSFHKNEKQISSKHYKIILSIMFNDLVGAVSQSFNLGGKVVIREANPLSLSRDVIMIAQNKEPNVFLRDFFVASGTLASTLIAALPSYNVDNLNINISYKQLRSIVENDVSSQIGQKFLSYTNNIQKISLLLSVINNAVPSNLIWTGDLIVSIYQLQTTLDCPTDVVPQLAIDFHPSNIPLAQLSVNYGSLFNNGVVLNTVPQPVEFIFSNTPVGSGMLISPGNYYAVTIKRAGSADTAQIQLAVGNNTATDTRETLFNGSVWVDVPEESLWFEVSTDAAKVSDGQAYDTGHGIQVTKTTIDPTTELTVDYVLDKIPFVRNDVYYALVRANTKESVPVQDERTGNPIDSIQQFVPSVSLLNATSLANIQGATSPLTIGAISDKNIKIYNSAIATLSAAFHEYGMAQNQIVIKVVNDPSDGYRYDLNILELVSEIVNGNLNGAKFIPNISNPGVYYRVAKAELIDMIYGDVNGDGIVDNADLLAAQILAGTDLNFAPTYSQYLSLTSLFVNDTPITWHIINESFVTVASGTDGILVANPSDGTKASFQSASANFSSISDLGDCSLVITVSNFTSNNDGTHKITNLVDNHDIQIQKRYYTSDNLLSVFRADIDGNMIIDSNDIDNITNYVNSVPPFPSQTFPGNKVGTSFSAIRLTLEEYVDRADEYPAVNSNRNATVHPLPDIFLDGYTVFGGQDFELFPLSFNVVKQLVWYDYSVVVNSNPKMVPASFNYQSGYTLNSCSLSGINSRNYPVNPGFDPGRNDFFIPNNLVINAGGQIVGPDGYFYKVDYETSTILIEIPDTSFDTEKTINLLSDFIADYSGTGYTRLGYPAMKFADCSFVSMEAILNNQVRFGTAVQSFSPQIEGLDPSCLNGVIVDGRIGVSMDYSTGLLTLNFTNLYTDPVKQTLNTKIQITVQLKKAGWNNTPIFVNSTKAQNILGLVAVIPPVNC